jgi:hypothetical protein
MKSSLVGMLVAVCVALSGSASAQAKAGEKKAAEIAAHRAMAVAHEKAAKCLETGTAEKACHAQLEQDCRGLGIGKHCGMKHRH